MSTSAADLPPPRETLRSCSVFAALTDRELDTIRELLLRRVFAPGERIFAAGEPGDSCWVVETGTVEVLAGVASAGPGSPSGGPPSDEGQLAELGQGAFLGEGCLLSDEPHSATLRAGTEVVAYRLTRTDFDRLLEEDDLAAYRMLLAMAGQLHRRLQVTTDLLLGRPSDAAGSQTTGTVEWVRA